jgi:hypothetical protein
MASFLRAPARRALPLLCAMSLLTLAVPAVNAASSRPSVTTTVCLVSSTTARVTVTWRNFDADSFFSTIFKWTPRGTLGGEPDPVDVPGTSGTQVREITVDETQETGPTQEQFDASDRGIGAVYNQSGITLVYGPTDTVRRPHAGWPACA